MSTISSSSYQPRCSTAKEPTNSRAAASVAALVNRVDAITSAQQGEGHEREEPRDVEIEPVREHELEADQHGRGEGRELKRRAPPRHERERERAHDDQHLEHLLHEVQVRDSRGPVLAPAPEGERRLSI